MLSRNCHRYDMKPWSGDFLKASPDTTFSATLSRFTTVRLSRLRPLSRIIRPLRLAAPLVVLGLLPIAVPGLLAESFGAAARQGAQGGGASCAVTGLVTAGQTRLPGVEVTATPHAGGTPNRDLDRARRGLHPRLAGGRGVRPQGRAGRLRDGDEGTRG